MDAVKYIREKARMCRSFVQCEECPLSNIKSTDPLCFPLCEGGRPEESASIVEQWSREHPVMTNAMKFEEVFGEKPIGPVGNNAMCPPPFARPKTACACDCSGCRQWWDEPYKEPEGKE